MAQCKWCNRSGWFLSLNSSGLCASCAPLFILDVSQRGSIIHDSLKLVTESKNIEVRLSRLVQLLDHANALLKYEKRGIATISPPPSHFIKNFGGMHDQIIKETLKTDIEMAIAKANVAPAIATKINILSKVLLKIREYRPRASNPAFLDKLEKQVQSEIQNIQLQRFLDSAKKCEFKGQKKKALDQYYEALYLLRHDDVDDSLQKDHITFIESKIISLGGSLEPLLL